MVDVLVSDYGADPNAVVSNIMYMDVELFLHGYLISQNVDNVCPIHGAASSGKLDVIVELIEKHAVNPRCKTANVCKFT